jgi:hypothetical protein
MSQHRQASRSHPEVFMTRLMQLLVVNAGAALLLSGYGCSGRPPVIETTPKGVVVKSARTGLYTKAVLTKKEPDTFLADDGTICRVPADRFKDTAVHTLVYCNWQ